MMQRERLSELRDAYFDIRRASNALQRDGAVFEGEAWFDLDNSAVRRACGYELRVYRVDGEIEVCVVFPNGTCRTYA